MFIEVEGQDDEHSIAPFRNDQIFCLKVAPPVLSVGCLQGKFGLLDRRLASSSFSKVKGSEPFHRLSQRDCDPKIEPVEDAGNSLAQRVSVSNVSSRSGV
jgi:hypothetical protein